MISMTGYAKSEFKFKKNRYSIIVKSLNNKALDISIKTPRDLMVLDSQIRKLIETKLVRGKIDVKILDYTSSPNIHLDMNKLDSHIKSINKILPDLKHETILNAAIKLPDVFTAETTLINNEIRDYVLKKIIIVINDLNHFRKKEGKVLMREIKSYVDVILKIAKQLIPLEKKRIKSKKLKLLKEIKKEQIDYNLSRLELEMIYYFERADITEERVRLQSHIGFFLEVLSSETIVGKKLNFITQEMLREINTIGSKANNFEIQKRVVLMKEQVEKIKEQLQNIL